MKTKKFQNSWTRVKDHPKEYNTGEILTVSGRGQSIRQIVERAQSGMMVNEHKPFFNNPVDFDDQVPKINDLSDLDDLKNNAKKAKEMLKSLKKKSKSGVAGTDAQSLGINKNPL